MVEHAWPPTTRHLKVLEAAGLIPQERQGRSRINSIDRRRLGLARDWLEWFYKRPYRTGGPIWPPSERS
jgi:DNA-binding transcriptional ArsR family regulator